MRRSVSAPGMATQSSFIPLLPPQALVFLTPSQVLAPTTGRTTTVLSSHAPSKVPHCCVSLHVCVCLCVRVCTLYHSFKPLPPPTSHLPCMYYLQFSFPASSSTAIPPCVCASSRSWRKSCGKTCTPECWTSCGALLWS